MLTEKQQYWQEKITQWQTSGLNQTEFCRQHALSTKSFYAYKSYFKKRAQATVAVNTSPAFVPFAIKNGSPGKVTTPLKLSVGKVAIWVDTASDPALVKQWITFLLTEDTDDSAQQ